MKISDLQDSLRAHIWARIHRGELTGSGLSRDAGFQQAHMSNFLNARRGLSPEAMDRLLEVLQVDVLDLADPEELRGRALQRPERASSFESVPLVSLHDAADSLQIPAKRVQDSLKFRKRFLNRLKPDTIGDRSSWLRFVMVRADADSVRAMSPRLAPGAVLLLDRHYNSLAGYRRGMQNLYAVRVGEECVIRYVAVASGRIILRPHNEQWPVELLEIAYGRGFPYYIVGRVCHIAVEA
jgi:SOS-response transcriptional repressor LexA